MLQMMTIAIVLCPAIIESLDIRYHPGRDRHTLDIFRPDSSPKPLPVILFIHGGTWMTGDKDFFGINRKAGKMLARSGYVTAVVNYRLTPFVQHPEHARDIARAFAWIQRHINKYGGDPSRVVLIGHSAGGHLATLIATDPAYLADPELKLDASARAAVKGVIGVSGVYRIPQADEFQKDIASAVIENWMDATRGPVAYAGPVLSYFSPTLNPFRLVFGTDPITMKKASPLSHVRKGLPPFLLLYTYQEPPTLDVMARDFASRLLEFGVSAELRCMNGCNHRTIVNRMHDENDTVARKVLEFLENRFR
ncbi:MAG: alpha/beta hydrolase [Planctomycetia bacterium]|nr:alpha/beta hydrolase [Planctomycetia bacterium]